MKVDGLNWNYSYYRKGEHKAFICLCGEPIENTQKMTPSNEAIIQYAITVTDMDDNELFQQNYLELDDAIEVLNERYKIWEFFDLSQRSDGSGCDTCSAH